METETEKLNFYKHYKQSYMTVTSIGTNKMEFDKVISYEYNMENQPPKKLTKKQQKARLEKIEMRRLLIKVNFQQFEQKCTLEDEKLITMSDDEIYNISQRAFWNIIENIKERNKPPIIEEEEILETEEQPPNEELRKWADLYEKISIEPSSPEPRFQPEITLDPPDEDLPNEDPTNEDGSRCDSVVQDPDPPSEDDGIDLNGSQKLLLGGTVKSQNSVTQSAYAALELDVVNHKDLDIWTFKKDQSQEDILDLKESITVSNYYFKLLDFCNFRSHFKPKPRKKVKKVSRPASLEDEPSSESSECDTFKGLSESSKTLKETAIYLQMLKTMALLFLLLTLLNIPVLVLNWNVNQKSYPMMQRFMVQSLERNPDKFEYILPKKTILTDQLLNLTESLNQTELTLNETQTAGNKTLITGNQTLSAGNKTNINATATNQIDQTLNETIKDQNQTANETLTEPKMSLNETLAKVDPSSIIFLLNQKTPAIEYMTTYPRFEMVPVNDSFILTITPKFTEAIICYLEVDEEARGLKVSDPFGTCSIAEKWSYSNVTYVGGQSRSLTGPDGDQYVLFPNATLQSRNFVVWVAPEDLSLYKENITNTIDFQQLLMGNISMLWEDGTNKCQLKGPKPDPLPILNVTGCESMNWTEAKYVSEETFIGPEGVLFRDYKDKQKYQKAIDQAIELQKNQTIPNNETASNTTNLNETSSNQNETASSNLTATELNSTANSTDGNLTLNSTDDVNSTQNSTDQLQNTTEANNQTRRILAVELGPNALKQLEEERNRQLQNNSSLNNSTEAGNITLDGNTTLAENSTTDSNLTEASNQTIAENSTQDGNKTLGENATQAENATMKDNTTQYGNTTLKDNSTYAGNATLGENTTLPENLTLAENITQVENSTLADNATLLENSTSTQNLSLSENATLPSNTTSSENTTKITLGENKTQSENVTLPGNQTQADNQSIEANSTLQENIAINQTSSENKSLSENSTFQNESGNSNETSQQLHSLSCPLGLIKSIEYQDDCQIDHCLGQQSCQMYCNDFTLYCEQTSFQMPSGNIIEKDKIPAIVLMYDTLSIILILWFFLSLKAINDEMVQIMQTNFIKMSDFTIQINNLKLDKSTYDPRMLKMKIWLHFAQFENLQIADIQASYQDRPKFYYLMQMNDLSIHMEELNRKIKISLSQDDKKAFKRQLKEVTDQYSKIETRYQNEVTNEKTNHAGKGFAKIAKLGKIRFVWVTFKSTEHAEIAMKILTNEFEGQKLNIGKALEPEEIVWQNSKQAFWPEIAISSILISGIIIAAIFKIEGFIGEIYVGLINVLASSIFTFVKLIKNSTQTEMKTRCLLTFLIEYFNTCFIFIIMGQKLQSNIVYAVLISILAPNYLAVLATCISLSSSMPLLYLTGFIFIAIFYVGSKFMIFKHSFKPNFMVFESLIVLQISLFIHILVKFNIWHLLLFLGCMLKQHYELLPKKLQYFKKQQKAFPRQVSSYRKMIEKPSFSDNFYKDLNMESLTKHCLNSQKDLQDIRNYFNLHDDAQMILDASSTHPLRRTFEELCYVCNLTFEEVTLYLNQLEQRVLDIQVVIDSHFNLIQPDILQHRKDVLKQDIVRQELEIENKQKSKQQLLKTKKAKERIMQQLEVSGAFEQINKLTLEKYDTYERKLNEIIKFQNYLVNRDKETQANRRGIQTICRIQAQVQTYFVLEKYPKAMEIYCKI